MASFDAFLGPSGQARAITWASDVCRNLYPVVMRPPTKGRLAQLALYGTPGHRSFSTLGTAGPVDMFEQDGRVFAATRTRVYELISNGTATELGTITGDSRYTHFASNGDLADQVLINGAGTLYVLNLSTNLVTAVSDPDVPAYAIGAEYVDGYFIVSQRDSLAFHLSDLLDGTAWSSLDAAEKSRTADRIVRVKEDRGLLWLFGRRHVEIWYNSGDPAFPWTPVDNTIVNQGLVGVDAVVKVGGERSVLAWLGADADGPPIAYRAAGYQSERISTEREEHAWAEYARDGRVDNVMAWSYQIDGSVFLVFMFPSQGKTWVCNMDTKFWHEWSYFDAISSENTVCLGRSHVFAFGKHLVGSSDSAGTVYEMDPAAFEDDGDLIVRVRRAPHIAAEDYPLTHARFAIDMQTGDAPLQGDGENPSIGLVWSDDAGRTWGNPLYRPIGRIGQYQQSMEWQGLGMTIKGRTYEARIACRNFVAIQGAFIDTAR